MSVFSRRARNTARLVMLLALPVTLPGALSAQQNTEAPAPALHVVAPVGGGSLLVRSYDMNTPVVTSAVRKRRDTYVQISLVALLVALIIVLLVV